MSFLSDTRNSDNGFFSGVSSGLGDAVGSIFSEVLPVWAAKELDVQRDDQLSREMFNQAEAPPRYTNYPSTTESSGQTQKSGLLFDNVNVSGAAILGVAVAVVAGVALARL